jgi:lipopolysaccharide transport system permease protein
MIKNTIKSKIDLIIFLIFLRFKKINGKTKLGYIWLFIKPILMLLIYLIVFVYILNNRWGFENDIKKYTIAIFIGITIHGTIADSLINSSELFKSKRQYILNNKIDLDIFPIYIFFYNYIILFISILLIVIVNFIINKNLSPSIIYLPVVLVTFMPIVLSITILSSVLSLRYSDFKQSLPFIINALLFLSPTFYSIDGIPGYLKFILIFNPITWPIESIRDIILYGLIPTYKFTFLYLIIGIIILIISLIFLRKFQYKVTNYL